MNEQKPITEKEVREAAAILKRYKEGKSNLERRIIDNEEWFRMRHWNGRANLANDPDYLPKSAWLFNSLANKHADAMDNFPAPAVLPREESDTSAALTLSKILPVILEENGFEKTYSDAWWYKLKHGTGVYGVFWDPQKAGGLGDIDIEQVDLLNLFWEPGVRDLQASRNLFNVELVDNEVLLERYPELSAEDFDHSAEVAKYIYDDTVDTREKTPVIDWYYKRGSGSGQVLHLCKYVGEKILFSSENEPALYPGGYYAHGKYPFVFDVLYLMQGSPAGFGCIDLMKDAQMYIDRLGGLILKNAEMSAKKRYFIRDDGALNEDEFADFKADLIHVAGGSLGEDSIRELIQAPLPQMALAVWQMKIDELKETSGNRDFSQGGTNSGVTAAAAIAALQEAGTKLSRDMIKTSYRAFCEVCSLTIELVREFYSEPRLFRIVAPNGQAQFIRFDNRALLLQNAPIGGIELGERKPVFDISVTSQKASPFSKAAQNELALQLYSLGFFRAQMRDQALAALSMMDFEGKDAVVQRISAQ